MQAARPDSNGRSELALERERIREAMLDLVTEQGYAATSVGQVLERAGVGRAKFNRLFSSKEDCFLQIYEEAAERFNRHVFGAFESEEEWRDGLRAAAYAAARWIRDHPRETRYGTVEMMAAGEFAQAHREVTLRRFTEMI
ncbi:MAG TPA: helix-turn-helix domain-containing protein, partial [Solirubrobacterales bacterium]|nr:helix-turn-helix domain-containing protein [Solirubrobacterales bacterium]